jgi:hypothetical protein
MRHYDSINAIEINFLNVRLGNPVFFKQYDNNNILEIQILQNDTEWVLTNETVTAFFLLPDGTTLLEKNATIVGGNAHIIIDNNILSQSGTMYMELNVVSASGEISTSPRITMTVEATMDRNGAAQTVVQWDILTEIQTIKTMFNALTVSGNNLLKNSDFKAGNVYWLLGSGWTKETTTVIDKSADSMTIARTGLGSDSASHLTPETSMVAAKQNETYTFSVWLRTPNSSAIDGGGLAIYISEYNSSSTYLANSTPLAIAFTANNTWQKFTVTYVTTNASCAYVKPIVTLYRNGTVYATKLLLEKNNKASDWKLNNLDLVERKIDPTNSLSNSSIKTDTTNFVLDTGWARDTAVYRNSNAYPFKIARTGLGSDNTSSVNTGHNASNNPTVAIKGESWVASVWVMSPDITLIDSTAPTLTIRGRDVSYGTLESNQVNIKPSQSNVWERFYVPITLAQSTVARISAFWSMFRNGTLYVSEPQIEKGILPTDWKQSPSDLASTGGSINADTLDTYHASSFVLKGDQMINVKDYGAVGNGSTNDSTAIQSALDALGATGGTLLFPKGTYMLSASIKVPSYCKLQGLGSVTLKRNAAIDNLLINKSDTVTGVYAANSNIILDNLIFDGNAGTYGTTNCTLVGFGHCDNIKIMNCTFKNIYSWHQVEFNAVSNGSITGCVFKEYGEGTGTASPSEMVQLDYSKDANVFPWFTPYDNTPCTNIRIHDNHFVGSTNPTYRQFTGIGNHTFSSSVQHTHITITNNQFENLERAIDMNDVKHFIISHNQFKKCDYGVYINDDKDGDSGTVNQTGCQYVNINNNTYYGNYVSGAGNAPAGCFVGINTTAGNFSILTQLVTITGNTIFNAHYSGIAVTCYRCSITSNMIGTCGYNGIALSGGTRMCVVSNTAVGCALNSTGSASLWIGGNPDETQDTTQVQGNNFDNIKVLNYVTGGHVLIIGNTASSGITNTGGAVIKQNIINGTYSAG